MYASSFSTSEVFIGYTSSSLNSYHYNCLAISLQYLIGSLPNRVVVSKVECALVHDHTQEFIIGRRCLVDRLREVIHA